MKIEVGKYYKNRAGEVLGPVRHNNDVDYPFEVQMDGHYRSFTTDGRYRISQKTANDLIEEVDADGSPIVPEPPASLSWNVPADRSWRDEIALRIYGNVVHGYFYKAAAVSHIKSPGWEDGCAEQAFKLADAFLKVANQS